MAQTLSSVKARPIASLHLRSKCDRLIGVLAFLPMFLRQLHLRNFRNYLDQVVEFGAPKTIVLGENAQGKSNLLESVQLLATGRTYRISRDRELVLQQKDQGKISAMVERAGSLVELDLLLRINGRRTARINGTTQRRVSDLLGQLNAVCFSSLDLDLVRGGPESRRDWLDGVLVQLEPLYVHLLEQYRRVLQQRNSLLKQAAEHPPSPDELALWDAQLVTTGVAISRRRARLIDRLAPMAIHWHTAISGGREALHVRYSPKIPMLSQDPVQLQHDFLAAIDEKKKLELMRGTSLIGPHRDEVDLSIDETPARLFGSQGQQRTLVLALKLAELALIESVAGEPPLLLLDDVLAELDLNRQNQLLDAIGDRVQTIVTTTHLGAFDSNWLKSAEIFTVNAGIVSPN